MSDYNIRIDGNGGGTVKLSTALLENDTFTNTIGTVEDTLSQIIERLDNIEERLAALENPIEEPVTE